MTRPSPEPVLTTEQILCRTCSCGTRMLEVMDKMDFASSVSRCRAPAHHSVCHTDRSFSGVYLRNGKPGCQDATIFLQVWWGVWSTARASRPGTEARFSVLGRGTVGWVPIGGGPHLGLPVSRRNRVVMATDEPVARSSRISDCPSPRQVFASGPAGFPRESNGLRGGSISIPWQTLGIC